MTEIYKNSENIDTSPFQEGIVLENYFAGANRDEVLSRMKEALQCGVALMVVTGDEGSGKTMMCRMLEHEAPPSCVTVFFPLTVDSFEDVVNSVALRLSLDAPATLRGRNVEETLQQITGFLKGESKELLVIFDEAENIYLATLERIRKMLDRVNGFGVRMHILFSGRKTFLENCDQLSICDFQNTDELHFELSPLSEAETVEYLKKCGERLADADGEEVFSDKDAKNIYEIAKGNFRMTNFLAEESINVSGDDTSFVTLPDSGKDEVDTQEGKIEKPVPADLFKRYGDYLPWVGGVLCLLLLLVFLFGPGEDKSDDSRNVQQPEEAEMVPAGTAVSTQEPEQEALRDVPAEKVQTADGSVPAEPPEEEIVTTGEEEIAAEEEEIAAEEPQGAIKPVETVPEQSIVDTEATDTAAIDEQVSQPDTEKETEKAQVEVKVEDNGPPPEEEIIVELHPTGSLKKKPDVSPEVQRGTIKLHPPRTEVQEVVASNAPFTVEQLLQKRLLAGASWEGGGKNNMYTVQLMVLASRTAEKNLMEMLAQDNYRQEAENFYIFKKATVPENIFVFYGEYPSISMARLAQDSLPRFLRDHKPYVISIKEASAKVE